jgi:hypothetical protein
MKGFTARPSREVTFTRGSQRVTYTVQALPPLFMGMVRSALPYTGKRDDHNLEMKALILAAEGLRQGGEDMPPHPDPGAGAEEWTAYAGQLSELYARAGLTVAQVNAIGVAVSELDQFVTDELDTVGND